MKLIALIVIFVASSLASAEDESKAKHIRGAYRMIRDNFQLDPNIEPPNLNKKLKYLIDLPATCGFGGCVPPYGIGLANERAKRRVLQQIIELGSWLSQGCTEHVIRRRHMKKYVEALRDKEFRELWTPMGNYFRKAQGKVVAHCLRFNAHDVIKYLYKGHEGIQQELVDFFGSVPIKKRIESMRFEDIAELFADLMQKQGLKISEGSRTASLPDTLAVALRKNWEIFELVIFDGMPIYERRNVVYEDFADQRLGFAHMVYESIHLHANDRPAKGQWLIDEFFKHRQDRNQPSS